MKKEYKLAQKVYRLTPCPSYDVEEMECWLSDMAQEGLFLQKDGFFAGVATFEYANPRPAKYRLDAARKSSGMWAEDGGEPDPEQIELSEKYAWNYIAKRGNFYVYRSYEPGARELNTDPEVQALALNAVKKRQGGVAFWLLFWLLAYPLFLTHGGVVLSIISVKTWLFLLTALFVIWMIADELIAFISLGKLQKKLRNNGVFSCNKDWRKSSFRHHTKRAAQAVLAILLVCFFAHNWSLSVMNEDMISLGDYTGDIPFATMQDFAGENDDNYRLTMTGLGTEFNAVKEWSDWLAPRCMEYNEHAQITLSDGRILDGGLYVDYYQTAGPALARRLVKECYRIDKAKKGFELTETPTLYVDYAAAYYNELHFPTILIQEGNIVVRAFFYQTSSNYTMALEDWIEIFADSITEQ